jgi:hypothetical protein
VCFLWSLYFPFVQEEAEEGGKEGGNDGGSIGFSSEEVDGVGETATEVSEEEVAKVSYC